jgi:hypothetical protein
MGVLTAAGIEMRLNLPGGGPGPADFEHEIFAGPFPVDGAELLRWRIMREGIPQTMKMLYGPDAEVYAEYGVTLTVSLSRGERVCCDFSEIGDEIQAILEKLDRALDA